MTGYQKLKKENEMLWEFISDLMKTAKESGYLEISEEGLKKQLAWKTWLYQYETHKEKN